MKVKFYQLAIRTFAAGLVVSSLILTLSTSAKEKLPEAKADVKPWNVNVDSRNFEEIVDKRNRFAKHFRRSDGTFTMYTSPSSQHYMSPNGWQEINLALMPTRNGKYAYANEHNSFKTYYPHSLIGSSILTSTKDGDLHESIESVYVSDANNTMLSVISSGHTASVNVSGNAIEYRNAYTNSTIKYSQQHDGRKFDFVINDRKFLDQIPANAVYLVIKEKLHIPASWSVKEESSGINLYSGTEWVANVPSPMAFESTSEGKHYKSENDLMDAGILTYEKIGDEVFLYSTFSVKWLKDKQRNFPVSLDPIVNFYPQNVAFATGYQTSAASKTSGYIRVTNLLNVGWASFDISTLPAGATIASGNYWGYHYTTAGDKYCNIIGMQAVLPIPSSAGAISSQISSGPNYNANYQFGSATLNTWRVGSINATGLANIAAEQAQGVTALGFSYSSGVTTFQYQYGYNGIQIPYLVLDYSTGPCVSPPTPGTSTSTPSGTLCSGTAIALTLTGNSGGTGQTYQWESSAAIGGPYTTISPVSMFQNFNTVTTSTLYYRCAVTCSGNTQYSTPILITVPAPFPGGTYTINSALPTGGSNFNSFTDGVSAILCGIGGPIVFNVAIGSGPYAEQIEIPQIGGASNVNTITINGNGETLTYNAINAAAPHTMALNGADFIKINNLNFLATGATYAFPCHLWNDADNNKFTNCTFTCPANGTSTTMVPFSISGSATSATTAGVSGSNDTLNGCTMNSGYYNTCIVGNSLGASTGNYVNNCHMADFYLYGVYCLYQNGVVISNNLVDRPTRTTLSTFYGIFISTGNTNALVEKNRIRHPFAQLPGSSSTAYAIYCSVDGTPGNENSYINNVISNMESNGTIGAMYLTGADYIKVYHNTISLDHLGATAGTTYGIFNTGTLGGIDIRNNIISLTRGGTGTKYCLYYNNASTISNKNVLYLNSIAGLNYTGYFGGLTYVTLPNWQTANGNTFDQQSSAANPLFFAPLSNDYTPTELSFNNIGDPVGVMNDITGFARSASTPDPGAYEYANAPLDISTTALFAPDSSGCYAANQNVIITIQNSGIQTIDFAINPATVTVNVTGALVTTVSAVVNSGTLAPNATLNVTLSPSINMTGNGVYTFNASTVMAGDGNAGNNNLNPAVSRTVGVIAGTITSNLENICVSGTPTLTSAGASGGTLQWKESTVSPAGPWTNVGAGMTTYTPATPVTQTTYYQLDVICNANTVTSNTDTVTVNNPSIATTTADTICEGNTATLSATANVGNISWFAGPLGGVALYTGSPFTTPVLNATTTYYVETSVGGGGGNASPILVTEMDLGGSDRLEIQNVSPDPVNVTGWKVYVSNSYGDILSVNAISQTLSGTMNPGALMSWTDNAGGPNYWGNNILWNPGAYPTYTGWAAIVDNNNVLRDIAFMNWPAANIASASIVMGGNAYAVGNFWSGPGVDITTVPAANGVARIGSSDNNTAADFSIPLLSINATNPQMTIPFTGFGCAGSRVPVTALVNPTPAVTANPATAVVCEGSNITLTGGGAGAGGSYTWSGGVMDSIPFPATASGVYTVTGTSADGCSNTATSDIIVNSLVNGTATASPDTICLGGSSTFNSVIPTICGANVSGFAGYYAPANWVYSVANSNGTVNTAGAPANIVITSGTNTGGQPGSTNYTRTIGCAGTVSFNWNYTNADAFGSIFDYPRYTINGGAPVTFSSFVVGGSNNQNGVESILLNAGDELTLQMYTIDNDPTPGITTISNLSAPAGPVGGTVTFWDSPSGGVNVGVPPMVVTPVAAGTVTYYAEYTALGSGCVNPVRDTVSLIVNALPVVTATPATQTVCEMGIATVNGGGAATYAWTGGISDATPFMVMAPAVYTVTGTDANGCTNTATAEVLMNTLPVITAGATPATTCEMTTVTPSASGAITIGWSGGLTNNVPFVATATTTYTVTGTDINGCTNSTTVLVTVNPMSGILAPATSNQSQDHGDDFDINYYAGNCDLIATVDDGAGGNVLGMTTSTVNVDATAGMHNGQPFVRRWYQITPTTNGAADVVLYINQSDFDDYNAAVLLPYLPLPILGNNADPNIANIRITKNDDAGLGNSPVVITPTVNWNGTYWELSFNTPNFSQFRVHSVNPGNVPLPVTITHFSGLKLETSDKLSWTTSSEQNNATFNLQHSTDGIHFTTLAKVNSKAANGNSATPLNYSAINSKPVLGHNYYRLQQTDLDNKLSVHAQIVDLIWGANGSTVSIYPNPATDILNIDLYAATAQNTTVKLLDMSGRVIKQIQAKSAVGMNNIKLSMGDIANGVYTLQVYENNTLSHTSKVKKND